MDKLIGLEKVLDIIEAKIGKRDNFTVQDVVDFYRTDNVKIIDVMGEGNHNFDIEHYAFTGEWTEEAGYLEMDTRPGQIDPWEEKFTKGYWIILMPQYLSDKYGKTYYGYCKAEHKYQLGFINVQVIMVATFDGELIYEIDETFACAYTPFKEEWLINWAFRTKLNIPAEVNEKKQELILDKIKYWMSMFETEAIKYYGLH